ncbi:hypothetical protein C9J60_22230 [Streptomyces sp. A244]|nr:hypothetical protein C9J60_22230 [Streptomyces sp. A244]
MGTAGLRGGGHRSARKRTQACPRARSAVRRRPSLPRPVRIGPPDRHQQRRLAPSQATPGAGANPSPPVNPPGDHRRVRGRRRGPPVGPAGPVGAGGRGQWAAGAGPPGEASGSGPLAASASL